MFGQGRKSPHGGVFETSEPIVVDNRGDSGAAIEVEEGLLVFRTENGSSFADAGNYHNAALEQGYHSEFTQVNPSTWHVWVASTRPTPENPLGIKPLWSDEEIDQMVEDVVRDQANDEQATDQ